MRRTLVTIAAVGLALLAAGPASAGTLTTQNSCRYSLDGTWRHQNIDWSGTGTPKPVAPRSGLTLAGTTAHVRLPDYILPIAYELGFINGGDNELPVRAWLALAAPGTPQGVQLREVTATARTTVVEGPESTFVSATPIDVTVPIPDTAWTSGTAAVGFQQAAAGTLPPIPAGIDGGNVTPTGSVYISTTGRNGVRLQMDCQPGSGEGAGITPTPAAAGAFETVAIDTAATVVPAPKAKPAVALRSTSLKAAGRRVSVALSCTAANCNGAVTLKAGSTSLAAKKTYAVKSGARKTVTLTLKKALAKTRRVTLRITAEGGKTLSKQLTLRPAKAARATAAAPKRVVAIEWDTVENLHMLGMAPVGAADMKGYDTWVAAPRPRGMKDVGSRQSPSIERIAALRPDLIVVPDYRSTKNLAQLKKIAPVLVTHPYPSRGSQLNAMITDFRRLAAAVGRKPRGEQVLQDLANTLARNKTKLSRARRAGAQVAVATPGGTSSAPAIRMFSANSATADVVRRLGLRDGWSGTARYGFSTVGLEALSRVKGWLAFVYPPQFQRQVSGITKTSTYKRLPVVKGNRVRTLGGTTWLFGGPRSTMLFADRLTAALT